MIWANDVGDARIDTVISHIDIEQLGPASQCEMAPMTTNDSMPGSRLVVRKFFSLRTASHGPSPIISCPFSSRRPVE